MKTKAQKLAEAHTVYQAAKTGQRPKTGAKDGSIPTHPVVPCPDLPELGKGGVQDLCHKWLKARRIFCNTHTCGPGPDHTLCGIKYAGDEIGILPDGHHFELEYKKGRGGRLSKGQQDRMAGVRAAGGVYLIIHGWQELEYYMAGLV
jgi:hypothetical protein